MLLETPVTPDYEAFLKCLRREGTPGRVHVAELFLDPEMKQAVVDYFHLDEGLDRGDPHFAKKLEIRIQRTLGYDYVTTRIENFDWKLTETVVPDTMNGRQQRAGGRPWMEEHRGPIASWEEFEKYPWPDPRQFRTDAIEWYSRHLPDDMCLVAGSHCVFEITSWSMGFETFAMALYEQPDLVNAVFERVGALFHQGIKLLCQFDRIKVLFGGDDMGFRSGTMVHPQVLIGQCLPWHAKNARAAHLTGKLYVLHSCGNLSAIMGPLIEEVGLDGKHSFEDVIESVIEAKRRWGARIALLGGIDVDLLTRRSEAEVRRRVREVLEACQAGGGYCLGTGNTACNYIPLRNFLAMIDEGRRWR
jgi:uroporphyrinogen decarboxylase